MSADNSSGTLPADETFSSLFGRHVLAPSYGQIQRRVGAHVPFHRSRLGAWQSRSLKWVTGEVISG
jgi:hypothetical protein